MMFASESVDGIKDVLKVNCPEMLGGSGAENLPDWWEEAADFYLILLFFCFKFLFCANKLRIVEKKPTNCDRFLSKRWGLLMCKHENQKLQTSKRYEPITSRVYTKHHS